MGQVWDIGWLNAGEIFGRSTFYPISVGTGHCRVRRWLLRLLMSGIRLRTVTRLVELDRMNRRERRERRVKEERETKYVRIGFSKI